MPQHSLDSAALRRELASRRESAEFGPRQVGPRQAGPSQVAGGAPDQQPPGSETQVSDEDLLRAVLRGEGSAYELIVARYQRRLYWVAYHILGRAEDARDVVQESFVRVHRSMHRFDFSKSFSTWVHRIATNLAIDALRKRKSARSVELDALGERPSEAEGPSEPAERREVQDRVWAVLDRLDPKFRAVLVLRDIHGLSCREIAPILKVTHATARWRLHRGRQVFRETWDRVERTEGG